VGVTAVASGVTLTAAVPITAGSVAAAAGAGAGISTLAIIGIVAAAGVAGAVIAVKLLGGKSSPPQGTIGAPTGVNIGAP
jgi:hypothetical protein